MTDRITVDGLHIAQELHDFVVNDAMPGTGVDAKAFWAGFSKIVHDLAPKNRALLKSATISRKGSTPGTRSTLGQWTWRSTRPF
jgi:malate synthase